jgi:hypothetical protein
MMQFRMETRAASFGSVISFDVVGGAMTATARWR